MKNIVKEKIQKLDEIAPADLHRLNWGDMLSGDDEYSEGTLLKELRTVLEVPQKQIAQNMGISAPTLSVHEKRQNVNPETVEKYLHELGMEMEDFYGLKSWLTVTKADSLKEFLNTDDKELLKLYIQNDKKIQNSTRRNILKELNESMEQLKNSDLKLIQSLIDRLKN